MQQLEVCQMPQFKNWADGNPMPFKGTSDLMHCDNVANQSRTYDSPLSPTKILS